MRAPRPSGFPGRFNIRRNKRFTISPLSFTAATIFATAFSVLLLGWTVLIAGVAAFFSLRGTKEEGQLDTPESAVPYICLDCGNQFPVTPADYDRLAKENRVKGSGGGMDAALQREG